jgi:hypothetical protein
VGTAPRSAIRVHVRDRLRAVRRGSRMKGGAAESGPATLTLASRRTICRR